MVRRVTDLLNISAQACAKVRDYTWRDTLTWQAGMASVIKTPGAVTRYVHHKGLTSSDYRPRSRMRPRLTLDETILTSSVESNQSRRLEGT